MSVTVRAVSKADSSKSASASCYRNAGGNSSTRERGHHTHDSQRSREQDAAVHCDGKRKFEHRSHLEGQWGQRWQWQHGDSQFQRYVYRAGRNIEDVR